MRCKTREEIAKFEKWSQDGEDMYLFKNFFSKMVGGFFIEMGALDGIRFSNSLMFERYLGWTGYDFIARPNQLNVLFSRLLVEPNPVSFAALKKNRPNAYKFHGAICGSPSSVRWVSGNEGAVTGIYEFMSPIFLKQWHPNIDPSKLEKIKCDSLANLLGSKELVHVRHVDFFSLDVEGGELEVLKTFPFNDVTIGVLLIENDGSNKKKEDAIRDLLKSHGYCFREAKLRSDWFVQCDKLQNSALKIEGADDIPQSFSSVFSSLSAWVKKQSTDVEGGNFNIDLAVADALGGYSVVMSSLSEKFLKIFPPINYSFLVQVIAQKVYVSYPTPFFNNPGQGGFLRQRVGSILRVLLNFTRKYPNVQLEAVFNVGDGPFGMHPSVPVFGFVSCENKKEIPFPIWDQANGPLERWDKKVELIRKNAEKYSWRLRIPKVVFRGGLRTCIPPSNSTSLVCGRELLVRKCLKRRELCDAVLSDTYDRKSTEVNLPISRMPMDEQEKFKYGIYTEGHFQWANRAKEQMFMGSTLLMQTTECKEYYTSQLKPFYHFIPTQYYFSDIFEVIEWANTHEMEIMKMRERMLSYAYSVLTQQKVEEYAFKLLESYSKLLRFPITRLEKAVEVTSCVAENIDRPELCREFEQTVQI
jgi:hypothetical protein